MKMQKGFTLIELIAVMVILGILAAVAVPRFVNLQKDARIANLDGMRAALLSAGTLTRAGALVRNQMAITGTVEADGNVNVTTRFGYPDGTSTGIGRAMQDITGFNATYGAAADDNAVFDIRANCLVTYNPPTAATDLPAVTVTDTGC